MHLFGSQTYDFDWWMVIWRKITCSLTGRVHFLECPSIRDFTEFVSFSFSCAWASDQCSFSRATSLLVFAVPKTVLPFCYGTLWVKWNWRNLALSCISEDKIVCWQQDYMHNFIISTKYLICVSFSQTIWKWDPENLGNLSPPVPSNPPTLPQLSSRTSTGIRKNFCLYLLINSCFFIFFSN